MVVRLAKRIPLRSNRGMHSTDEDAFRDSVKPREAVRSGFYEPSISTRGSRNLQRRHRRKALWPRFAIGLVLVGAFVMLWVRFRA